MKKYGKSTPPKVSFLLINWNGIKFTKKCISSLLKTDYPNFEIVVLDNGSDTDEAGIIEKNFKDKVRIIRNKENIGYAAGMNLAYKHSKGDYIMVLNNDMEFNKNWLWPLVEVLQKDKSIGAVQPKIKDLKAKKHFEYSVAAGGFIDILGYTFARGRLFSHVEEDKGQYETPIKIAWAGVFLARREVLKKTGFFDPVFFTYAEDVDLCYRIYGQGYSILYVPTAVVYHYGGGVMGQFMSRKMYYIHRNHMILILKNWHIGTLSLILIPRILLDVLSVFYYIASGYTNIAVALIKAYGSLIIMFPTILKMRSTAQKKIIRKNLVQMPVYHGSIVWDYFVRKKRTFVEIMQNN